MKTFKQFSNVLLEAGLNHLRQHIADGPVGVVSAARGTPEDKENHKKLIHMARAHGYSPIEAQGKSKKWGDERSVVIPGASVEHTKKFGEHFNQDAVIHMNKGEGHLHWLNGDKKGVTQHIGKVHFNQRDPENKTVIKNKPTANSFSFEEDYVLESLQIPRNEMLRREAYPLT